MDGSRMRRENRMSGKRYWKARAEGEERGNER
jgi:hypothetical protein